MGCKKRASSSKVPRSISKEPLQYKFLQLLKFVSLSGVFGLDKANIYSFEFPKSYEKQITNWVMNEVRLGKHYRPICEVCGEDEIPSITELVDIAENPKP